MRFAGPFSSRFRNAKRVSLLVFAPNGAVLGANWGELHRIADPVCHGAALVQWVCRAIGRSAVPAAECTVRDGGREDLQWSVISPAQKWLGLLGLGLPHPPPKKNTEMGISRLISQDFAPHIPKWFRHGWCNHPHLFLVEYLFLHPHLFVSQNTHHSLSYPNSLRYATMHIARIDGHTRFWPAISALFAFRGPISYRVQKDPLWS